MKKLFHTLKEEKLTNDEKAEMLSVLKDFMHSNPVETDGFKRQVKSPFYPSFIAIIKQRKFAIPTAFLLIFALTTGTVFGAKGSVPGDILYPVKILNENIRRAVAIGTKAKAKISAEQAISRLEEAEKLATKGDLTEKKTGDLKLKFEEHTNKIKESIEELKKEGNDDYAKEISKHFENSIDTQKNSIDKLVDEDKISASSKENFSNITSEVEKEIKKEDGKVKGEEINRTEKNPEETQKSEPTKNRKSTEVKTEIRGAEERPESEN